MEIRKVLLTVHLLKLTTKMTGYKKIAIIADIHGNSWALEAVLEDLQKRNITEIVNLGDIFYGPLNPAKAYELVSKIKMTSISGNVDRYMLEVTLNKTLTPTIPLSNPTMSFVIQSFDNESLHWISRLPKTTIVDNSIFLCQQILIHLAYHHRGIIIDRCFCVSQVFSKLLNRVSTLQILKQH